MSVFELLSALRDKKLKVWADGDRLRVGGARGSLTPELRRELERYKAEILDVLRAAGGDAAAGPIARVDRAAEIPLSLPQQRLWFLQQLDPANPAYHLGSALWLEGDLDHDALRRSLEEIVRRHESLRTRIVTRDGRPYQVVVPTMPLPLQIVDLRGTPAGEREAEIGRIGEQESRAAFDMEQGPLLRFRLLQLDEGRHVFLLTIHHILTDAWSRGVFFHELTALYTAFVEGRPSPLPDLPVQYPDYAVWQRQYVQGARLDRQLAYWKRQLEDLPVLELPTDRSRPAVQTSSGARHEFALPGPLSEALQSLCHDEGVTLTMLLLAAYQLLLFRCSGQEDIAVGCPIANRPRPELEGLIGFFANTLVMRTDLSGNPSFRELLQRVHRTSLDAYEHQDVPFETLVETLQPERDLSRSPLYQVVFAMRNAPPVRGELRGLRIGDAKSTLTVVRADIELHCMESPTGILGRFIYSTDLFDASTIQRMAGYLQRLLQATVADPTSRIEDLPLLPDTERETVLVEWNRTERPYAESACLHELIEAHATESPDAVAIVHGDRTVTYAQLEARANQIAHTLRDLGVGPDVLVGLCVERCPEMVIGLLAVLKAGGAYVPLDPMYPAQRLAFMLEDCGARVLVTQSRLLADLPVHGAEVLCLDRDRPLFDRMPETRPLSGVTPDHLAYMIYTSGSTGTPKGALLTHRGLCSLSADQARAFGVGPESRVLQFSSLSFDASTFEIVMALPKGAALVLGDRESLMPGPELIAMLRRHRVSIVTLPPSALAAMPVEPLPDLQTITVAGEACAPEIVSRWAPGRRFFNLYGPTETTIWASMVELRPGGTVSIGRPIANTKIYVLDAGLRPVPVGVPGELCIAGIGLARGYHRRPALTADTFVPNPFDDAPGARMYRTGDLGRWRADGEIEFLGRVDHQVKVRGFRIELGEIEAALGRDAWVSESVVTSTLDEAGRSQLVAYVVPASEATEAQEHAQVEQWRSLYEETYGGTPDLADATFNIAGWNSSYTGEPIPAAQMREWVDQTVARVLETKPRRVLEIGCGSGLVLFRVAEHCEMYAGTDFSKQALAYVERHLEEAGLSSKVRLEHRPAEVFEDAAAGAYDTVILNSIAQYFPSVEYLVAVLEGAVRSVDDGGVVFLGDVRSLPLLAAQHASVQLHLSSDDDVVGDLRRRVHEGVAQEEELALDPAFFTALAQRWPRVTHVEVMPRRGESENELTKFRYDVRIFVGREPGARREHLSWQTWGDHDWQSIRSELERDRPEVLALRDVPNARTCGDAWALEVIESGASSSVAEVRCAARERSSSGVPLESWWRLGAELDYGVHVSWLGSAADGRYDVLLTRGRGGSVPLPRIPVRSWGSYGNSPLQAKMTRSMAPRLREHLSTVLPEYMVPSSYVVLETLPLTPNGKVDRKALPDPGWYRRCVQGAYEAPRSEAEALLAGVWGELLGVDRVSIHDNFFELGGHSLLATQVVSRIREVFSVELPVRALFDAPTVAGLAERLDESTRGSVAPPIVPVSYDGEVPLSFAQQRLMILDRLGAGAAYNVRLALRLHGRLDEAAIRKSLATMLQRHDVLRARFIWLDGSPVQEIVDACEVPLTRVDLEREPAEEREEALQRLAARESDRPFDLACAPLVRCTIARLREDEHALMVTMHHIVTDGWSMGIMLRELTAMYEAFASGATPPLPAPEIQYADFARWQRDWMEGDVLEAQLGYWRRQLDGAPPLLELPFDRARPALPGPGGARVPFVLSVDLSARLDAIAQEHGVSAFMILLAMFDVLLMRITGQSDIVVGTPVAGRNRREIEDVLGFFVNTLVMRVNLSDDPSFVELLGRVRRTALDAFAHQDLPFERLVEEIQPERNIGATPLFQVLFTLQNAPQENLELRGLTISPLPMRSTSAKFDLSLSMTNHAGRWRGNFEYRTELFQPETIERLVRLFEQLAGGVVADPERPVSTIPLLDEEARHRALFTWNDTRSDFPRDRTLHELIEMQAERTPDAVAIVFENERLTYAELNRRANHLAHLLRTRGVGPEVPVGICLDRGPSMVAAILGILKAGGAYVPLDPAHPRRRLAFVVNDAGAPIVVTDLHRADAFEETRAAVLVLDDAEPDLGQAPSSNPPASVAPKNLAYVLYTSGSTGQPKGVCVAHRELVNYVSWAAGAYGLQPGAVSCVHSPITFDLTVTSLWAPLVAGGTVELLSEGDGLDALAAALDRHEQVDLLKITPAHLQLLRRQLGPERGIRAGTIVIGGEQLTAEHVAALGGAARTILVNEYGPTETVVGVCTHRVPADETGVGPVPIGAPIANAQLYVLDEHLEPVPVGVVGELFIGGESVARGYLGRPDATAACFLPDPFGGEPGARLYRSGDLAKRRADGALEFVGRRDEQVKIRGHRVELAEIESALRAHPGVRDAVAAIREDEPGERELVAYVVAEEHASAPSGAELRRHLREILPEAMVPSAFAFLASLPLTANGKVDRRSLSAPFVEHRSDAGLIAPRSELEQQIARIWREVLGVEHVGVRDNFFDLGGHSLRLIKVFDRMIGELDCTLRITDLFQLPTIEAVTRHLSGDEAAARPGATRTRRRRLPSTGAEPIAVIAMAGRFPGAPDVERLWSNLRAGVESVRFFTDEELRAAGVPESLLRRPDFVKARAVLDGGDRFDAWYFGYNPREAELIDPQQRIFLECAVEALERAGYDPQRYGGMIGVYGGVSASAYLRNIQSNPELLATAGAVQVNASTDKDFLPTRVSYKLNLRGPSVTVQTACSTSLVAVHEACRSLSHGDCDIALAGGVSFGVPAMIGYLYQEGGIASPDGHCRAFDARAQGCLAGDGAGIVVLKRLEEALRDGDHVHAVIRGTAINNDGAMKVGYTAPSVGGQAEAIAIAQAGAEVDPSTITYVEAHGTGTALGDPIEVAALQKVFGERTSKRQFCALGSLKSNMGHLDAAAGVAGLIKTALALEHAEIPPSLHYERPNPEIDFERSAFFVNTTLRPWVTEDGTPRRAGVSSFGLGGTNAHAVLEEAPALPAPGPSRSQQVLVLSAKTETALEAMTSHLASHLRDHADASLADVAHTLQVGRTEHEHRRAIAGASVAEAIEALEGGRPNRRWTRCTAAGSRPVAFLFPGQGAQHVDMGRGLYDTEPAFRETVDACLELVAPHMDSDLRSMLYPDDGSDLAAASARLTRTSAAQPALFVVSYALAALWRSWGVVPSALIGHSIGEYVAACLSGVLELPDALRLVALRGRLMESMPEGVMLSVPVGEERARELIGEAPDVWLSVLNAPSLCVVSGTAPGIARLEARLAAEGLEGRRLRTSHAFHSGLMEEAVGPFVEAVRGVRTGAPSIPYASNVTGTWITTSDVADPSYWGLQIREPVRFGEGLEAVLGDVSAVLLEVGPGRVLSTLARQQPSFGRDRVVVASLREPRSEERDETFLAGALGNLWTGGVSIDWSRYRGDERRRRVTLPTYPFERERYWIERRADTGRIARRDDLADWFYIPSWQRSLAPPIADDAAEASARRRLVFGDETPLTKAVVAAIERAGGRTVLVRPGARFEARDDGWTIDPGAPDDYERLLAEFGAADDIVHLWSAGRSTARPVDDAVAAEGDRLGFFSLMHLGRALVESDQPVALTVVTRGAHEITGDEAIDPEQALVLGPGRVIEREMPHVTCRLVDLPAGDEAAGADLLVREISGANAANVVAYRHGRRWVESFAPVRLETAAEGDVAPLRRGGTYLITGGLGGIGLVLAAWLARSVGARLVLTARTPLPERAAWASRLAEGAGDDDEIARRIRAVTALEAAGAEVFVAAADAADLPRMREVVEEATARFGAVHGVIHAAGLPGGGMIALRDPADAARVLAPKVGGARVLEKLFGGADLDFLVLCSSLNAVSGMPGQADYGAANAYLDAFARCFAARTGTFVTSIDWSRWGEVGMAVETAARFGLSSDRALTNNEGVEILHRVLAHRAGPQVLISEVDLARRLAAASRPSGERAAAAVPGAALPAHARPSLSTEYAPPRSETERALAETWQALLGIDEVGIHDDFFELGGHSLLATQLLNRLNKTHADVKLSLRVLFDHPTIAQLAAHLDAGRGPADTEAVGDDARDEDGALRERLLAAPDEERGALLRAYVAGVASEALGTAPDVLPSDEPLGADAPDTLAADLVWMVKRDLEIPLYPHELHGRLTMDALVELLAEELDRAAALGSIMIDRPTEPSGRSHGEDAE